MKAHRACLLVSLIPALWACEHKPSTLPSGLDAYQAVPAATQPREPRQQRIGALDLLDISVFQEPDMSFEDLVVDADGTIPFPFLGRVSVAGMTPAESAEEIRSRLDGRYLLDPHVTVTVADSLAQKVAVEGLVNDPGVFDVRGTTTLLSILAEAKSPTDTAALDEVVVFRVVDGQRMGAAFDVRDIRAGVAPDPQILGGDTVVVGFSEVKAGLRLFLQTIPAFAVFRPF